MDVRDSQRFIEALEEVLSHGHPVRFRAEGWSMDPAIGNGATITIAPLDGTPIRTGDVVLYRQDRRAIAHRVVRVEPMRLVLRGDTAESCDAPISPDHVLGRVVAVRNRRRSRILGRALRALRTAARKLGLAESA
jgi:hypothetical protein